MAVCQRRRDPAGRFCHLARGCLPTAAHSVRDPLPSFFIALVDLPLQRFDAKIAREFAAWLHTPLIGATLNLLFYRNEIGIFIRPGYGLRGKAAMGLLGLRASGELLFIAAAVALAYVINLFRLCARMLHCRLAHSWPLLTAHAVDGCYLLGAVLFALAAAFLFRLPASRRYR